MKATPTARPAAGAAACARSQLRIAVDLHAAGVAAGTAYLPLTFVNVSARPCLLTGYPQVEPASGQSGHQVGGIAAADRTLAAHSLRIAAGGTAHAWLRLVSVGNLPAAQCHPVTAPGLLITVPGQAEGSFVRFPVQTCAKPERDAAVLTVDPFQPGLARKGSAP